MELRELLWSIADGYDRELGRVQPAMRLLESASEHLAEYIPVTHLAKGSTGVGGLPFVPWVAVFDPDETDTAQRGMYVVYLFAADGTRLYVSLNQGSDDLRNKRGKARDAALSVPQQLRTQASAIRDRLALSGQPEWLDEIDLRAPRDKQRPRNYEAGNIIAKAYDTKDLPEDSKLRADLDGFLDLYAVALDVRQQLALTEPGVIASPQRYPRTGTSEEFKPTDGSDYYVKIRERDEQRSRKHVPLMAAFADHLTGIGYKPNNQGIHPRDLTATKDGQHWLIEVKVVRRGDGQQASREAVAQLLEYRRFCYSDEDQPHVQMLAVFSENIGPAFVGHLESLGIASVWAQGKCWLGSPSALAAGLCP
jgi:hypothetical protein